VFKAYEYQSVILPIDWLDAIIMLPDQLFWTHGPKMGSGPSCFFSPPFSDSLWVPLYSLHHFTPRR